MNKILVVVASVLVISGAGQASARPVVPPLAKQQVNNTIGQPSQYADNVPVCVQYGDNKRGGNKSWGCNY